MQATLAQQITIFSFGAATFMLTLVGVIAFVSILRLMRIQRLEYERVVATAQRAYQQAIAETQTKSPLSKMNRTNIDIQIDPADEPIQQTQYKPRSVPNVKAG